MATTFTVLFRGAASLTNTTLYTTPASTTTVIHSVVVSNVGASNQSFDLSLGGVQVANDVAVPANDTLVLDFKQVLDAADLIEGLASSTDVKFHISGVEIV
jgi:hypothetical protein